MDWAGGTKVPPAFFVFSDEADSSMEFSFSDNNLENLSGLTYIAIDAKANLEA